MKRNDMILLLTDVIAMYRHIPDTMPNTKMAEIILNLLENKGMNPPGYMKPIPFELDGKQYPLVPGDFKNEEGIWCTPGIHEWEEE